MKKIHSRTSWLSSEGAPIPLGVTWIESEQAYNFALYSKHAQSVALLLYCATDVENPAFRFDLAQVTEL